MPFSSIWAGLLGIALAVSACTADSGAAADVDATSSVTMSDAASDRVPASHPPVRRAMADMRSLPTSPMELPDAVPPAYPVQLSPTAVAVAAARLRRAMAKDVRHLVPLSPAQIADEGQRAEALLKATDQTVVTPQLVVVVDRNPARQLLSLMLAQPPGAGAWALIGAAHVSTGQAGRKDHYITPIGVFPHTDAILDFRAQGTFNENHIRGLGVAGMRVWDFGWQWALKGWHGNGSGGDIRLMMHATDPAVLERRLGRPASEGCVRISDSMNRFLDRHGVLDADYDRAATEDPAFRALLLPDRVPDPLAGRLLIVIDTRDPPDTPPTAASRPADWPSPG